MDTNLETKLKGRTPFNISLLNLNEDNLYSKLPKVTSTNMFDGANFHLHPEGLWSNEIFGPVGDPKRMLQQAYIDLNIPILHPLVYKEIISASSFADNIMAGTEYAVFNQETKWFEKSNAIDGNTGYDYFVSYLPKFTLPDTGSNKRNEINKLINNNRNKILIDKLIVLQAGYRDVEFNDGQISHDEINNIYREILALSNSMSSSGLKNNITALNSTRYALQKAVLKLYLHLVEITGHGKKKLIQAKWASRTIANGTANVITATRPGGRFIGDNRNLKYLDAMMGLFQALVATGPFAVRAIKESFLQDIFPSPIEPARLINKSSLKEEPTIVDSEWYDLFQTEEGIKKKLIQRFKPTGIRHKALEVDGKYIALIWKGIKDNKKCFKIMHSISELPEGFNKEDVYPLTYIELLYITTINTINKMPANVVRYPITGIESTVPANINIHTTVNDEDRYELDDDWNITDKLYLRYPIIGENNITSSAPPISALSKMGGDFRGLG